MQNSLAILSPKGGQQVNQALDKQHILTIHVDNRKRGASTGV